jgi:hypothetical protein
MKAGNVLVEVTRGSVDNGVREYRKGETIPEGLSEETAKSLESQGIVKILSVPAVDQAPPAGSGDENPPADSPPEPTVVQLKEKAEKLGVKGYKQMNKEKLLAAIAEAEVESNGQLGGSENPEDIKIDLTGNEDLVG